MFARINYYAFVCLTTVGFGDITPNLPLSRIISVCTAIAGPLYLAVVMGVLISRYTGDVEEEDATTADQGRTGRQSGRSAERNSRDRRSRTRPGRDRRRRP